MAAFLPNVEILVRVSNLEASVVKNLSSENLSSNLRMFIIVRFKSE
jgi:hypothetical protein